jgi:hypothetical protein
MTVHIVAARRAAAPATALPHFALWKAPDRARSPSEQLLQEEVEHGVELRPAEIGRHLGDGLAL